MHRARKAEYGVRLASRSMYVRGLISVYHDWYENGNDAQKARYTELWEYFRNLAVNSSYIFAGGKSAQLSDFDINENIALWSIASETVPCVKRNGGTGSKIKPADFQPERKMPQAIPPPAALFL